MLESAAGLRPTVVVAALPQLGDQPDDAIARLVTAARPELFITLYSFARREVIERLSGDKRRVLKGPVSPQMLRAPMMGVIVRSIMSNGRASSSTTAQRERHGDTCRPGTHTHLSATPSSADSVR